MGELTEILVTLIVLLIIRLIIGGQRQYRDVVVKEKLLGYLNQSDEVKRFSY